MRICTLFFIFLMYIQSSLADGDSTKSNWEIYGSIGLNKTWLANPVRILHLPIAIGEFTALPTGGFNKNPTLGFIRFKSAYQIDLHANATVKSNGKVLLGVGVGQFINVGDDISAVRFVDMIDPDRGFVMGTNVSNVKIWSTNRYVKLNVGYSIQQVVSPNYIHQLGFKIHLLKVMQSAYLIEYEGHSNKSPNVFWDKDIKYSDGFYAFYYSIVYGFEFPKWKHNKWSFDVEYNPRFGVNSTQNKRSFEFQNPDWMSFVMASCYVKYRMF